MFCAIRSSDTFHRCRAFGHAAAWDYPAPFPGTSLDNSSVEAAFALKGPPFLVGSTRSPFLTNSYMQSANDILDS